MPTQEEIEIKDLSSLPEFLYHLVPKKFFKDFVNDKDDYDCRHKEDWGGNSAFIHTSPTKKQLKERVADSRWASYPLEEEFLLLEINPKKINTKITYSVFNGNIYHHIWGSLPKESYNVCQVSRDQEGKFLI